MRIAVAPAGTRGRRLPHSLVQARTAESMSKPEGAPR